MKRGGCNCTVKITHGFHSCEFIDLADPFTTLMEGSGECTILQGSFTDLNIYKSIK